MRTRTIGLLSVMALGVATGVVGTQLVSGAGESEESVFVSTTPCRLVDTRSGDENVGPVSSPVGPGATVGFNAHDGRDDDSLCEIPASATAISANVVAVAPTERGFLTLFPGDVENPGTANLNFVAGQAPTPNAAVVPLASDGTFNVFNAFGAVDVVIDVAGFYQPSSNVGAIGPVGPQGPAGPQGDPGVGGGSPARVIWVADDGTGDFALLSAALASIDDASETNPYLVRIAPGVYEEPSTVVLKDNIDVEGSGRAITRIECDCGDTGTLRVLSDIDTEVRNITIANAGSGDVTGVRSAGVIDGSFSMIGVSVIVGGGTAGSANRGIANTGSSPDLNGVTVAVTGPGNNDGVSNESGSAPQMSDMTIAVSDGAVNVGVRNVGSSPVMNDIAITASDGIDTYGLYNDGVVFPPIMSEVTVVATGGSGNDYGAFNTSAAAVFRNSAVIGDTASIVHSSGLGVFVADTLLGGPVSGAASFDCVGAYTQMFVALGTDCM